MSVEKELTTQNEPSSQFLGQDLYRRAIKDGNLGIFSHVDGILEDTQRPLVERANAFRAIRFGLVGIAIDGWQNAITQPLSEGPKRFGSGTIAYGFIPNQFFPVHDSTVIDERSSYGKDYVRKTQGEYALDTLTSGLKDSMAIYLANTGSTVNTIKISSVLDALLTSVIRGRELGLAKVADLSYHGHEFTSGEVYKGVKDQAGVISAISDTARNPLRFMSLQVLEVMNHYSGLYPRRFRNIPSGEAVHPEYRVDQIADLLMNTSRHVTRASQRMDGTSLVTDANTGSTYGIYVTEEGEITWPDKGLRRPPRKLDPGEEVPKAGNVAITSRQKCPIGYTLDADSVMPIGKIYNGVFLYITSSGLIDPIAFSQPKILATTIG